MLITLCNEDSRHFHTAHLLFPDRKRYKSHKVVRENVVCDEKSYDFMLSFDNEETCTSGNLSMGQTHLRSK